MTETLDAALSHTRGETDTPLIEQTIGDNFDATVARFGDREALVDVAQGKRWTYRELQADVDRLARALMAAGVTKGDRVGIWAPNCAEWTLLQYATARVGAILVNINPAYRAHELTYVAQQSGLRMLVSAQQHKTSDYRAMVEEVRGQLPDLREVVYIGDPSWEELVAGGVSVTEDDLMLAVLDAGAEEINDLGESFEIVSEAGDFVAVREALQAADVDYDSAESSWLPTVEVPLDKEGAKKMIRVVEALEDSDDVQDVYTNVDIPDDVAAERVVGVHELMAELAGEPLPDLGPAVVMDQLRVVVFDVCRAEGESPHLAQRLASLRLTWA